MMTQDVQMAQSSEIKKVVIKQIINQLIQDCTCTQCIGEDRALCGSGQCIHIHKVCDSVRDCEVRQGVV